MGRQEGYGVNVRIYFKDSPKRSHTYSGVTEVEVHKGDALMFFKNEKPPRMLHITGVDKVTVDNDGAVS